MPLLRGRQRRGPHGLTRTTRSSVRDATQTAPSPAATRSDRSSSYSPSGRLTFSSTSSELQGGAEAMGIELEEES